MSLEIQSLSALPDLSSRQREVVSNIRRRRVEGRPLNLTAMKRENPALVAEVFAMRPFWGWRRAVESAGLRYEQIPVALEDTVECLVCGARLAILSGHLAAEHGLSRGEYHDEFPDAYSVSEEIRATRMRPPRDVPHWEAIWSPEYVVDRVRHLHDLGFAVNVKSVDPTLAAAGRKYWETWDAVLRAADLDPRRIRLASPGRPFPGREEVIGMLLLRKRLGLPLNSKAVKKHDSRLMNAARKAFGTWARALLASGIRPREVRLTVRHRPDLDRRLVQRAREIVAMADERQRRRALAALKRNYASFVSRHFGGWANLARSSGVPPERLFRRNVYARGRNSR
jgi:hypothetical protein